MRLVTILSIALLIFSCKKPDQTTSGSTPVVQGKYSLEVTVMHHNLIVPGITVYLKKDTLEFPGADPSIYNRNAVADAGGVVLFDGLFPGNYFVYGTGYDNNVKANVKGGAGVTLNSSTVKNDKAYLTLYVTE